CACHSVALSPGVVARAPGVYQSLQLSQCMDDLVEKSLEEQTPPRGSLRWKTPPPGTTESPSKEPGEHFVSNCPFLQKSRVIADAKSTVSLTAGAKER
ncbi:MAG TPA: hypothetical protein QF761_08705, partial [Pirellulales bacterium]|nr:hypothetical protein [Pirellulales bacterium]